MNKMIFAVLAMLAIGASGQDRLLLVNPTNSALRKVSGIRVTNNVVATSNCVPSWAVIGASSGPATNEVVKTGTDGRIAASLLSSSAASLVSTNMGYFTATPAAGDWGVIGSLTTTATTGVVMVQGRVGTVGAAPSLILLRLRDAATNVVSAAQYEPNTGGGSWPFFHSVTLLDSLSGTAKTYTLEFTALGAAVAFTNVVPATVQNPTTPDAFGIKILQFP